MISVSIKIITWDPRRLVKFLTTSVWFTLAVMIAQAAPGLADPGSMSAVGRISLTRLEPDTDRGFGYRLEYYVLAPIEAFWRFKTDFDSDILLTNEELVGHRLIDSVGRRVITENRYASAPGLRFLWQTDVNPDRYRLEFKLLNPKDCRHDHHYGSIQLTPAGSHTKVTLKAYFDFKGASLWVKYPWYGGMKYTLTKVAQWEQKMAAQYKRRYLAAITD